MPLRRTKLRLGNGDERVYVGYVDDANNGWNGWARPYFSQGETLKILRNLGRGKHPLRSTNGFLNQATGDIYVHEEGGGSYHMEPIEIDYRGKNFLAYPLGAGSWVWEEVE